jgi:hypothetical protein
VSDDELVKLTEVGSESEAAVLCGYLDAQGIRAIYDSRGVLGPPMAGLGGGLSPSGSGGSGVGRQAILVRAEDLEAARALLADLPE